MKKLLASLLLVSAIACSSRTSQPELPAYVFTEPADLTSGLPSRPAFVFVYYGVHLQRRSSALVGSVRLARLADGAEIPLALGYEETGRERQGSPRLYNGAPYLRFEVQEDLAEGWYLLSADEGAAGDGQTYWRPHPRQGRFPAARFGARIRVGSGPVLRSLEVCDKDEPRVSSVGSSLRFGFSEPVGMPSGSELPQLLRILGPDGSLRSFVDSEGHPSAVAANQRILEAARTGSRGSLWMYYVREVPPDLFQLQISDALRTEEGRPVRSYAADLAAVAASRPAQRVEPVPGITEEIAWRTLPLYNGCRFWTP